MTDPTKSLDALELAGPPRNEDAEKAVLGCCLLDVEKLDDVALVLRERDFHVPQFRMIYRAMLDLREANKRPDTVLLVAHLKRAGKFDDAGGFHVLHEISESVPTHHNAVHYAELVRDCSILRDLIDAGCSILNLGRAARDVEPRELIARAEAAVFGILDQRQASDALPVCDVLMEAMNDLESRLERKGQSGLRMGFTDLDQLVGGLRGGELIILAARPGMGKSALATNVAEKVSLDQSKTVLFFSLEMHRLELAERIVCGRARVDSRNARNGNLTSDECGRMTEQSNRFSPAPLFIDDTPGRNMAEIAAVCRRQKRRRKLDLVIVDYLQRIHPDDSRAPREQQVAAIATRLKTLARELNVPILCLAQLNRRVESSVEKRPRLSDLRESGAIEQEADQVWFVHREDYYRTNPAEFNNLAEILVEKNRAGATGRIDLAWFAEFTRFETVYVERDAFKPAPRSNGRRQEPPPKRRATPQSGTIFNPDEHEYPGGGDGDD